MTKRMIIMLIGVGVVLGLVFGFVAFKSKMIQKAMAGLANPPQTVSTTVAKPDQWQQRLEAGGSPRAGNGADLSLELAGIVGNITFNSGDDVPGGRGLVQLRGNDDIAQLH